MRSYCLFICSHLILMVPLCTFFLPFIPFSWHIMHAIRVLDPDPDGLGFGYPVFETLRSGFFKRVKIGSGFCLINWIHLNWPCHKNFELFSSRFMIRVFIGSGLSSSQVDPVLFFRYSRIRLQSMVFYLWSDPILNSE